MLSSLIQNLLFLLGAVAIILLGVIPGDSFEGWLQIHPILMAWVASFIIFQKGNYNALPLILIAIYYIALSGVALSLGAASLVIFALALRYAAQYYNQESILIKWLSATAIYVIVEFARFILLSLIFAAQQTLMQFFINILVFLIFLPIFHPIGRLLFKQDHRLSRK